MILNAGTLLGLAALFIIAAVSVVLLRRKIKIDKNKPFDNCNDFNEPW